MCDEQVVGKIVNSQFLRIVECIMLVLSIFSIPTLFQMFRNCKNSKLFHFNIRLIGGFHCICLLIHCLARIVQHSADLLLYFSDVPICHKMPSVMRCFLTRVPYIFGLFCASYSTVFMVIERTMATKNYKKYENRQKTLGMYLLFGQIFMGTTTTCAIFWSFDFDQPAEFCSATKSSSPYYLILPEIVAVTSNFVAFYQFSRLIKINRKIRVSDAAKNLSQKYQVEENLSIITILRAFTKCDFVFILIYFTMGIPFHFLGQHMEHAEYYALFELIYFVPLYSLIMPAYIYRFSRKQQEKRINRVEAKIQVPHDAYFNFIKDQWKK